MKRLWPRKARGLPQSVAPSPVRCQKPPSQDDFPQPFLSLPPSLSRALSPPGPRSFLSPRALDPSAAICSVAHQFSIRWLPLWWAGHSPSVLSGAGRDLLLPCSLCLPSTPISFSSLHSAVSSSSSLVFRFQLESISHFFPWEPLSKVIRLPNPSQ